MATAALVGAVGFNGAHFAAQRFDCVIAVDGGLRSLSGIGAKPDIVLGDFDSLGFVPQADDVRRWPPEKDLSDMELAFRAARDAGCGELLVYGGLGGRLDHTLANIQLMAGFARAGGRVFAIADDYAVALLHGAPGAPAALAFGAMPETASFWGSYGPFISVFAVGGAAEGVTERGLKYSLYRHRLADEVSLGLSNEFAGAPARISVEDGSLLVVFPLRAWGHLRG